MKPTRPQHPAALPEGTEVGPWRVVGLSRRGAHGTVYRAQRRGHEHERPVALKVANRPLDERFEREGGLLSRVRHPSVPQLLDGGWWRGPDGDLYPFLVMEWVEGVELCEWAQQPGRTWVQGVRVLAQVASALAATHAVGGVHLNVQGESVLVREDGSAVLVGFGGGEAHSEAGAAEDVYALGVMAWRLVEGRSAEAVLAPEELGKGEWLRPPVRRASQALGGAGRELKGLIRRMLSPEPWGRGSAAKVLRELERVERKAGSQAERPLRASPAATRGVRSSWAVAVQWTRARGRGLRVAVAALVLAVGGWSVERQLFGGRAVEGAQPTQEGDGREAGTAEVADTAVSGSESAKEGREPKPGGFRLEVPKDPRPGQLRPPCKPPRVVINGGCWRRQPDVRPPCDGDTYAWGDGCYWPVMTTSRTPTSEPR